LQRIGPDRKEGDDLLGHQRGPRTDAWSRESEQTEKQQASR
jgi:hypothetical protein